MITSSSITSEVVARIDVHVGLEESLVITVDGPSDRRPRFANSENSLDFVTFDLLARCRIEKDDIDTEERKSRGSRLGFGGSGKRTVVSLKEVSSRF